MSKYKVVQITDPNIWEVLITDCYMDSLYNDPDLLEKYAFNAPTNVEALTKHTLEAFRESINFRFFSIWEGEYLVGYFGSDTISKDVQMITGMYVFKSHRNKEFIGKYIDILKSKFGNNIFIGLWLNNTRAQKFVKKLGFKHFSDIKVKGQSCIVYKLG